MAKLGEKFTEIGRGYKRGMIKEKGNHLIPDVAKEEINKLLKE